VTFRPAVAVCLGSLPTLSRRQLSASARALNIDVPISSLDTTSQLKFTSSDIENAKAAIAAGEKQVTAAQARILEAEAENVKAQDDVKRYHLLLAKDEVPAQTYDHAVAAAQTDNAGVNSCQSGRGGC
jgi:membrane fusion protein (multidrug efflux system)